jgi:hypothetical protein
MEGHEADRQNDGGHRCRKIRLLALVLASALGSAVVSLVLSVTSALGHAGYPRNGGFEAGTSYWNVSHGATCITVTEPVSSGTWAASLTKSDTTGEVSIYQDVPIFPGATYTLTGWVFKDEFDFCCACLRLEWRPSTAPPSQDCLTDDNDFYRPLTVGPVAAPAGATKVRIRAVGEIATADPQSPIYFDEIKLTCSLTPRMYSPLLLKSYPR